MTDMRNGTAIGGVEVVTLPRRTVAGLRRRVPVAELAAFFGQAVPAVLDELLRQGIEPAGPPISIYRGESGAEFEVTVGFPVEEPELFDTALVIDELPAGRVARTEHRGPYETLPAAYGLLGKWFAERQVSPPSMMWEEYLVGPDAVDEPGGYRTRVVYPLHRGRADAAA